MARKKRASFEDEMRPEYDLRKLKFVGRGIYAERYKRGVKFVLLDEDDEQVVEEHDPERMNLNEPRNISNPRER